MSNIAPPWSSEQIARAVQMKAAGEEVGAIALAVGRSIKAVQVKLSILNETPERRASRQLKHAERCRANRPGSRKIAGVGFFYPQSKKPDCDVLQEREIRLGTEPRDLTAAFFGDPRPGYSALERRV